jgi:hypothetical protein
MREPDWSGYVKCDFRTSIKCCFRFPEIYPLEFFFAAKSKRRTVQKKHFLKKIKTSTKQIRFRKSILRLTFQNLTIYFNKSRIYFARNRGNKTETIET